VIKNKGKGDSMAKMQEQSMSVAAFRGFIKKEKNISLGRDIKDNPSEATGMEVAGRRGLRWHLYNEALLFFSAIDFFEQKKELSEDALVVFSFISEKRNKFRVIELYKSKEDILPIYSQRSEVSFFVNKSLDDEKLFCSRIDLVAFNHKGEALPIETVAQEKDPNVWERIFRRTDPTTILKVKRDFSQSYRTKKVLPFHYFFFGKGFSVRRKNWVTIMNSNLAGTSHIFSSEKESSNFNEKEITYKKDIAELMESFLK